MTYEHTETDPDRPPERTQDREAPSHDAMSMINAAAIAPLNAAPTARLSEKEDSPTPAERHPTASYGR